MTKLYEITTEMKALSELVESGELTSEQIADTMEAMSGDFNEKGKAVAMFIENVGSDISQLDTMIKSLTARKKSLQNKESSLRSYLAENMHASGVNQIKSPDMTISYVKPRESVVVDCDPIELPMDYQVTKIDADKRALLKDLKDGKEIQGARVVLGNPSIKVKI